MKRAPRRKRCPYPETFLTYTYIPGTPVKEFPPRPLPLSFFKERCSISRAPFNQLSKSTVDKPSSSSPNGAPMERDARLQSLFYISFRVPSKGALPLGSFHRVPTERYSTFRAPFQPYL